MNNEQFMRWALELCNQEKYKNITEIEKKYSFLLGC